MSFEKIIMQQQQADGSYQELWPKVDGWNKSQVLSDLTRELLGLKSTSIPDDAFIALTIGKDSKAYRVKVTYPNGQPAVGFTVGGLTAFPALSLVTNANGIVMGSSTSTNPTITVAKKYDDVKDYSGSFTSTRMITDCNIVLSWNEAAQKISSSSSFTLSSVSPYATKFNYLLVAAGGSAGGLVPFTGGGGGGYYSQGNVDINQGDNFSFVIGAGSVPSQSGDSYTGVSGGNSSFSQNGIVKDTALGGSGGGGPTSQTTPSGRDYYCQTFGGTGRRGNGKGGDGGNSHWYEDYEENFVGTRPYGATNGGNGQPGTTVNFGGLSIRTGGGGFGGGRPTRKPGQFSSNGVAASSDAGLGGSNGPFASPNDCAGYNGAAWYYISH